MDRIILPKKIEVVVASFGGVGTTFLLSYLAQYKKTNHPDDVDGFKHSPLPPVSFNPNIKFVYIYGEPQLAAISLFRRNYQQEQSGKLQNVGRKEVSLIPKNMTLEEYVAGGVDKFHFRNHFYNWYQKYLFYPTLFIRYETLFDHVGTLLDFLELPKDCIDNFPEKRSRTSSDEGVPAETLQQLNHMYGDFSDELASLDDVEIRTKAHGRTPAIFLKGPYLRAFSKQLAADGPNIHLLLLRKMKQLAKRFF